MNEEGLERFHFWLIDYVDRCYTKALGSVPKEQRDNPNWRRYASPVFYEEYDTANMIKSMFEDMFGMYK